MKGEKKINVTRNGSLYKTKVFFFFSFRGESPVNSILEQSGVKGRVWVLGQMG